MASEMNPRLLQGHSQLPGPYKMLLQAKRPRDQSASEEFGQTIGRRLAQPSFKFTPPEYDEQFRAAIEKLDAGDL